VAHHRCSTGRLRQSHGCAALALCVRVGAADCLLDAPLHEPRFVRPSRVERLVCDGEHAEADRQRAEISGHTMRQRGEDVRAQIALRAGDTQRLDTLGRPLLKDADDVSTPARTTRAARTCTSNRSATCASRCWRRSIAGSMARRPQQPASPARPSGPDARRDG
jgi:hypothetical protein